MSAAKLIAAATFSLLLMPLAHAATTVNCTASAGDSNFATGTLYGLIPASQDVAPGAYSDVITVTVTY